ncbi:MAG: hypothetical protein CMM83_04025 [Rhodospirillales bacterium]|nr:hypothetical protein [Rhodospirillales bacterium]
MRIWDILAVCTLIVIALLGKYSPFGNDQSNAIRRPPIETVKPPRNQPLPPSAGPVLSITLEDTKKSSTGTAFSVAKDGIWVTARHVADGCEKIALQTGTKRFTQVRRIVHHPNADISILQTNYGAQPLPGIGTRIFRGQDGYSFGFPKGKPGDVHAKVIGRRTMAVKGRYSTREPVVAWAQINRIPDRGTHLGGISGGPWVDKNGLIIGVHVAGAPRRGRSYSSTPQSLLYILKGVGLNNNQVGNAKSNLSVHKTNFSRTGDSLRQSLTVTKVFCIVRNRWR